MPQLEVTIIIKQDGVPVFDTPLVKRLTVNSIEHWSTLQRAAGSGYQPVGDDLAVLAAFVLQADQQLGVKLAGGANVDVTLNPGGLLLMVDGLINATPTTNITASNLSTTTANVSALIAGT